MKNKLLFASCIAAALLLVNIPVSAQKSGINIKTVYTDDDETTLNFSHDDHKYKVRMTGKRITEMFRDGSKVAPEDYNKYDSIIKEVLAEIEKQREEAEKMRQEAEVQRKEAEKMRGEAEVQRKQADEFRAQADKQRGEADKQRKEAEVFRAEAGKQREQAEKQRVEADKQRVQADKQRAEANKMRLEAEEQRKQSEEFRAQAEVQRKEAEKQREQAEKDRELMEKMLDEIVAEKIVDDREKLKNILLDDKEFVVNGIKQSDSLHKQFKAKYLTRTRIKFQINNHFRGISVQ